MKTYSIQDNYNDRKFWIVKVYNKGEVYYNQEIAGQTVNSRFQRITKSFINQILDINLNELLSDEEHVELLDNQEPEEFIGQDGDLHTIEEDPYWGEQRSLYNELDDLYKAIESELEEELDTLPF